MTFNVKKVLANADAKALSEIRKLLASGDDAKLKDYLNKFSESYDKKRVQSSAKTMSAVKIEKSNDGYTVTDRAGNLVGSIFKITKGNWRPGMPKEGYGVHYALTDGHGWSKLHNCDTEEQALEFAETLASEDDIKALVPADFDWFRFNGQKCKNIPYADAIVCLHPRDLVGVSKEIDYLGNCRVIIPSYKSDFITLSSDIVDLVKGRCHPFTGNVARVLCASRLKDLKSYIESGLNDYLKPVVSKVLTKGNADKDCYRVTVSLDGLEPGFPEFISENGFEKASFANEACDKLERPIAKLHEAFTAELKELVDAYCSEVGKVISKIIS